MHRVVRAVVAAIVAAAALVLPTAYSDAAVPAGCTLSGPLFSNPYPRIIGGTDDRVTSLSTYQHGLWAGYEYSGSGDFRLISWTAGRGAHVLAVRRPRNVPSSLLATVDPVGVTPSGAVVANMQDDDRARDRPFAYVGGRHVALRTARTWRAATILSVTDDGDVLGYGTIGSPGGHQRFQLAVWRGLHAAPLLRRIVSSNGFPVADQSGDFAWATLDPRTFASIVHVRLASGTIRTLESRPADGQVMLWRGSGGYIFGRNQRAIVRWNIGTAGSSDPIPGQVVLHPRNDGVITAAGANGDFVFGQSDRPRFSTRADTSVLLPSPCNGDNGQVGQAVAPRHEVAFTRARDHLVHLLTCR